MKLVRFIMPCKGEYQAELNVPDEIVDDTSRLADYINSHKADIIMSGGGHIEWNEDEDIAAVDLDYCRKIWETYGG